MGANGLAASGVRLRRAATVIMANVLGFLALCLVLELGLRVAGIRPPAIPALPSGSQTERSLWRYDATKGWSNTPSAMAVTGPALRRGRPADRGEIHTNSLGFRGGEVLLPKPPGTYRILVFGDSFPFGAGVDDDHVFPAQLELLLNASPDERRFEVLNMAVSGYATDQEYLLFQELGARLRPDLVVLVVCDNDPPQNTEDFAYSRYYKPYFELNDRGRLVPRNIPVPRLGPTQRAKLWLGQHSHLWNLFRTRTASNAVARSFINLFQVATPHASTEDQLGITVALIEAFREASISVKARFLVMNTGRRGEPSDLFDELFQRLEHDGVACLRVDRDLATSRERAPGRRWDFGKDWHWNVDSHRKVAEVVAAHLRATVLTEGRASVGQ